jgi:hypothetical protein
MGTQAVAPAEPATARTLSREQARLQLRHLDACLERLEGAHERGVMTVPVPLALAMRRYVPALAPGMAITHAMELVMREQEPHLACSGAARSEAPGREGTTTSAGPDTEIDERGARDLTERIRRAANTAHGLCSLLVEAHERRAWVALGYPTWSDYIRAEFRLSRSRSYELLDHGRVLRALRAATGVSGNPDISAYAAVQIKPHLAEVTEAIRTRTAGLPPEGIARVVEQIVWEVRSRHSAQRRTDRASSDIALDRLVDALNVLASMPDVCAILKVLRTDSVQRLDPLPDALRWLTDLASALRDHGQETTGTLEEAS